MRARHRRRIHAWLMAVWAVQMVAVWFLPVSMRVMYLVIVSIYANFVGHWGAYSAETPVEHE